MLKITNIRVFILCNLDFKVKILCFEVFNNEAINPKEKFSNAYQTDARKQSQSASCNIKEKCYSIVIVRGRDKKIFNVTYQCWTQSQQMSSFEFS